jgi:RNAse (barnase) inhibitor barstar/GNAT superfamily N-acetyltransferase
LGSPRFFIFFSGWDLLFGEPAQRKKSWPEKTHIPMLFREAAVTDFPGMHRVRMSVKENVLNNPLLVTESDYRKYLTANGKGWLCENDKEIIGFCIVDTSENNVWALFVHPAHEQKGIGRELQQTMLNWFFGQDKDWIWLSTSPGTRAEKFYRAGGWTQKGMTKSGEVKFEMTRKQWEQVQTVTIDIGKLRSEREFHLLFKEHLDFPGFYGMNWSAFWDAITGLVELPPVLFLKGWKDFSERLPAESRILKEIIEDFNSQPYNLGKKRIETD